ncbi:MAG: 3-oxoacyl-ACP reductase FabG [Clostridia bacterium]|nr:MAG: 3-oxoacyl-ACP reductase FabG [Clostridia bacterium]
MQLQGKVAIITGAGQGIGRAYAHGFAGEGARVVIAEVNPINAQKVADEIKTRGGEAMALQTDVSDANSTMEMARKAVETYGRIDILLNNAAVYYGIGFRPWDSWDEEEWDKIFAVNVKGIWLCVKAVAGQMKAQGKGKIINISSTTFHTGQPMLLPYVGSKGAVIALTRCLARELGDYGINVNCIAPGFTMSEASLQMPNSPPGIKEAVAAHQCFKRSQQPEDLVGAAVFLASDEADFITGQTIIVDGGMAMV